VDWLFPFKNSLIVLCADVGLDSLVVRAFFEGGFGAVASRLDGRSKDGSLTPASAFATLLFRSGTCGGTLANSERMDFVGAT